MPVPDVGSAPAALSTGPGTKAAPSTAGVASSADSTSPIDSAGPTDSAGAAAVSRPLPLAGKVVVLDPGHNGGNASHAAEIAKLVPMGSGQSKACDTTGTDADDGYSEHQFNFSVALAVQQLLEQDGVKVILTRTDDTGVGPCVNQRADIGNDAHADAAVSIHGDGFDASGHGFQIIQASKSEGGTANDARSNELSEALHATFVSESGLTPATYIGTDGYETRSDLAGLNLSSVPKALVECGNMKNAGDSSLMESASGRARMARAIAEGIIAFLSDN
jgi:N-acetylmuramoyl-L-alanine amidase